MMTMMMMKLKIVKARETKKKSKTSLQVATFKKITTFFNLKDMFRCYEHYRQLQNI